MCMCVCGRVGECVWCVCVCVGYCVGGGGGSGGVCVCVVCVVGAGRRALFMKTKRLQYRFELSPTPSSTLDRNYWEIQKRVTLNICISIRLTEY